MNDKVYMVVSYYKNDDIAGVDFCNIEQLEAYMNDYCKYKGDNYAVKFNIYTIEEAAIEDAGNSVEWLINNATFERTIKIDNPITIYEKLDDVIAKKISRYVRYSQRHADDDYWRGKLSAYVMIAHALIEHDCLDDALYEIAEQAVYADKIRYSSYNLGFSNACMGFINRARSLGDMTSKVFLESFNYYNTELYIVEYYDNDGNVLTFEDVITFKDAIKSAMSEMYSKHNLDASNMWHYAKAIIWHKRPCDFKTLEDVHSFNKGIGHYMSVIESL